MIPSTLALALLLPPGDFELVPVGHSALAGLHQGGNLTAFLVVEAREGADLNGDGDLSDRVLFVHDGARGVTHDTGLAPGAHPPRVGGALVAFGVSEAAQGGVDLNGDGDALDEVCILVDTQTQELISLGLAGRFPARALDDPEWIPFEVFEEQEGVDHNGDGDTVDSVHFVYRLSTRTATGLGLATRFGIPPVVQGGRMAFSVGESAQGTDLNADGDLSDSILHVRDLGAGSTTLYPYSAWDLKLAGGHVAFTVREQEANMDLSGDGFQFDFIPHVLELASGSVTNLGLAQRFFFGIEFDGRYLVATANEFYQGGNPDLNGDGDASILDDVLHVHDVVTGTTTNLGLTWDNSMARAGTQLAVGVPENEQGADLNGDGDRLDKVLHLVDLTTAQVTQEPMDLAFQVAFTGGRIVSTVFERDVDLNGDGDTCDHVLFVYDVAADSVTNTAIAVRQFEVAGSTVAVHLDPEFRAFDLQREIPSRPFAVYDLADGTLFRSPYGVGFLGNDWRAGGSASPVIAHERAVGAGTDVNGDGDVDDEVLVMVRRAPGPAVTSFCPATPSSAGVPAHVGVTGGLSLAADDVRLELRDAPAGTVGLFLHGPQATQMPFGDGILCIRPAGGIFRVQPPLAVDAAGAAERPFVPSTLPPAAAIAAGETRRFQFYFRDPGGPGGTGFNLSDAIAVTFAP